ncbi:MAG: Secretion system C-terminal sorting domain, partial [Bacteroidota bacterium]
FIYERTVAELEPTFNISGWKNPIFTETPPLSGFSVFPNPTKGRSQLRFPKTEIGLPEKILITDGLGNIISTFQNQEIYENLEIDFLTYPSGIYFIKAFFKEHSFVQKIVKI